MRLLLQSTIMAVYMLFLLLPPFLLLLLPLFLLSMKRNNRGREHRLPPGPSQLPIVGNFHQFREITHRSLRSLSKKYGSLVFLKLGRRPVLVVSSAEMAREVMKSHDLHFCSRPSFISFIKFSYNHQDVAFAKYGPHWRELRKISIIELFSSRRVRSFSSIRKEKVAEMIQAIPYEKAVNLSKMLFTLTNDIVLKAAFGKTFREDEHHLKAKLHTAVEETGFLMGDLFFTDYFSQLGWIIDVLSGRYSRLKKSCSEINSFFEKIIQEHLHRTNPEKVEFVHDMLGLLNGGNLTREEVKGLFLNVLIGGSDTSTSVLEWAMTELMNNPEAMAKVQKELRTAVQDKHQVEEDDLPCLEYLKSVIKETMRLHPPAPLLIPREITHPINLAGYDIPPKTTVFINAFAIGRDPESWLDPEDFVPERFAKSSVDYRGQDFGLIPFGAGRRGCPAIDFGVANVELALANLLYCFDWEFPHGESREEVLDMDESPGIIVRRKNPLRLVPKKYSISV